MAEKKKGKLQQMKRLKNNKHLKIERAETTKYIFNSIHFQLSVARRLSCFLPLPSGSRHKAGHEQSLVQVDTLSDILLLLCNSRLDHFAYRRYCKSLPFFYFLTFEKADCSIFALLVKMVKIDKKW